MSELENKTKVVSPSSTDRLPEQQNINADTLLKTLNSILPVDKRDLVLTGKAHYGLQKEPILLQILKDCLYVEVDNLQLSKNADDNNVRLATNKIKRSLKSQIDTILSILETSTNKSDNFYYLLGIVIGCMSHMEQ